MMLGHLGEVREGVLKHTTTAAWEASSVRPGGRSNRQNKREKKMKKTQSSDYGISMMKVNEKNRRWMP